MIAKFIDLDTGRSFEVGPQYVFKMGENGCSTGKWYSRTLLFLHKDVSLNFSFPEEDSYFRLSDTKKREQLVVNGHEYIDLNSIIANSLSITGTRFGQYAGGTLYAFSIPVVFMSDSEGEFHSTMTIKSESDSNYRFDVEFAADVYMEDERLSIDLANEGVEIPDAFQRAVYDTNVRDESSDKLLLNRKWKELLIEYWNVVANKGSYKSLINSLKFFEYSDLVRIEEYWRQKDGFGIEELIGRDIEQILDPLVREYLDTLTKTTYIGLYLALDRVLTDENGQVEYPENISSVSLNTLISEPNPIVYALALKWSEEDLSLKMTLLANYFSTYFMPIHLDLIHSSIERSVYTNTIKILRSARRRREDWYDSLAPLSCNLMLDKDYWIGNTRAFNYPGTHLRNADFPAYWGDLDFVGVDNEVLDSISLDYDGLENIKMYLNQYFGGVGCIVPVDVSFGGKLRYFTKQTNISIYKKVEGSNYILTKQYTSTEPVSGDEYHFNLLFTKAGQYCVMLQFVQADGSDITGSWYIDVHGSIGDLISIKRLKKIDYRGNQEEFDDWFYNNLDFNSFMFTEPFDGQTHYKQWLPATDGSLPYGIGINHIVAIDCGPSGFDRPIVLTCQGDTKEFEFSEDLADILSEFYPHYWWKMVGRPMSKKTKAGIELDDEHYFIIGVRKYFDSEESSTFNLVSEYYRSNVGTDDEDMFSVIVDYTPSTQRTKRGYATVTLPIGSEITIDNSAPFKTVSETTTVPMVRELSKMHMEYKISNHLFSKDVDIPDMFSTYGTEYFKVHPSKSKGFTTIDKSRFFPIFHRLEDIDGFTISREDTAVCIPNFRWVDGNVEDCYWEFTNRSTGEIYMSKTKDKDDQLYIEQPFVGRYDFSGQLRKGYYDVTLHFRMGGTEQVETVCSAFRIS